MFRIERADRKRIHARIEGAASPLTHGQELLWHRDRQAPGHASGNAAQVLRARGPLDAASLRAAVDDLGARHEALRTTYHEADGGPVQVVSPGGAVPFDVVDLRGVAAPAREGAAWDVLARAASYRFELSNEQTLRACLVRVAEDDHLLLLLSHHIAADDWSRGLLLRDLADSYDSRTGRPAPALPVLPVRHADFARWQREGSHEAALDWWRDYLASAPAFPPVPVPRAGGAARRYPAGHAELTLSPELADALDGPSLSTTLLAALGVVLARTAGHDRAVVGAVVSGRDRPELANVVGSFANTVPVRVDLSGRPSFAALLDRVRAEHRNVLAHQAVPAEVLRQLPFERLAVLSPPGTAARGDRMGAVSLEPCRAALGNARFSLALAGERVAAGVRLQATYDRDLFDGAAIEGMLGHIERFVTDGVRRPDAPIAGAPVLSGVERSRPVPDRVATAVKNEPRETLKRASRSGPLPLSRAQRQLWLLEQVAAGPACYNVSEAFRLEGELDTAALSAAVDRVVARHEALRAIIETPGNGLLQVFGPARRGILRIERLESTLPEQRDAEALRLVAEDAGARFCLGEGLLLRALLVALAADRHILCVTVHHAAADGWSMGILRRDLCVEYRAYLAGGDLDELAGSAERLDYGDYAAWQAGRLTASRLDELSSWWRRALDGKPARLALPISPPPSSHAPAAAGRAVRALDAGTTALVRGLARSTRATPFMVLLGVWQALLARWSGQRDVIVGCPVAGRTELGFERMVGCFVNVLPIRVDLSGAPSLAGLLVRVRKAALAAWSHQELPFIDLVETLGATHERRPIVQVAFVMQNFEIAPLTFPGVASEPLASQAGGPRFDLLLMAEEQSGTVQLTLEYDRAVIDERAADRLLDGYTTMLAAGLADPARSVCELPTVPEEERQRVLVEFNRTGTAYPRDACIHDLFHEQAERTPGAVAVVFQDRTVTYRELWTEACALAVRLQEHGIGADDRVAVCLERSERLVGVLLGVMAAGGCYVALDPRHPVERLASTCANAEARIVVADAASEAVARRLGPTVLLAGTPADARVVTPRDPGVTAGSLAYVCYTSGSTGHPKGVAVPHRGVVRLVRGATYASFEPRHAFLHLSPLAFDASTFEIWGPLLNGGRVVVMPPGTPGLDDIVACIERHGVTSAFFTTGLFNLLVDERLQGLASLEQVFFGGEACSPAHVARARRGLPACRLINAYGPTESTTFAVCHEVEWADAEGGPVPIGRPISNSSAYVLDPDGQPLPVGVEGELCLGGDGIARGYLARPELSAERFVPDRFRGGIMYRTGDIVRWSEEGRLEYVGRRDDQLKIRGFRVEPKEIEQRLIGHPEVARATVGALPDARGALRLVAWVVPRRVDDGLEQELKDWVAGALPDFMVPAAVLVVADIPLTPNGKVDRAALPVPGVVKSVPAGPRNDLERRLVALWEEVLEVGDIGIHDPFFDLGGHSLLAVKLAARIETELGIRVPLVTFYEARTVAEFARRLRRGVWTEPDGLLVALQPHGDRPPIFWVHSLGGDRAGSFMYYRPLAQLLGPDQPSYGIRAPEVPHATVEAMAADYIRAIEEIWPEGPVLLGGFCFGGNVAFEMARQLTKAGRTVPLVVMIESAVPRAEAEANGWKGPVDALRRDGVRGVCRWGSRALGRLLLPGRRSPGVWDLLDRALYPEDCAHAAEVHFAALQAYRPGHLEAEAVLFRQKRRPDFGWRELARGGLLEFGFDVTHEALVQPPTVDILAERLRTLIAERLETGEVAAR